LTVKIAPLLAIPPTFTITFPVVAPEGTRSWIIVLVQDEIELEGTVVPLKVTLLVPCVAPKLPPVIATNIPNPPEVGERLVIPGPKLTVNGTPLLVSPAPVASTTTLPVVALVGTTAPIELSVQLVVVAAV
jgi:hypothetical protein